MNIYWWNLKIIRYNIRIFDINVIPILEYRKKIIYLEIMFYNEGIK